MNTWTILNALFPIKPLLERKHGVLTLHKTNKLTRFIDAYAILHPFFCYSRPRDRPVGFFEVAVHALHLPPPSENRWERESARASELNSCTVRTRQVDQIWFTFKQLSRWAGPPGTTRCEMRERAAPHAEFSRSAVSVSLLIRKLWVGRYCLVSFYSWVEVEAAEDVDC